MAVEWQLQLKGATRQSLTVEKGLPPLRVDGQTTMAGTQKFDVFPRSVVVLVPCRVLQEGDHRL